MTRHIPRPAAGHAEASACRRRTASPWSSPGIEWPDKATRDAGMEKMMKDPRMDPANNPMPFDGKRMIYAGFVPIVELHGKK